MPAIPSAFLDCVVYLYSSAEHAQEGKNSGGSGFLVYVSSATVPDWGYVYVVTNYHVAIRDALGFVRLNRHDGGTDTVEIPPEDWEFIPGGGDLAIAGLRLNFTRHKHQPLPENLFLTEAEFPTGVAVGEDVFLSGRFVEHDGGLTNAPAVRFGNISIGPSYVPGLVNSDRNSRYFCTEMRTQSGFSGSPVFAYRVGGADLGDALTGNVNINPFVRMLGIHCGRFRAQQQATEAAIGTQRVEKQIVTLEQFSGMTYVLPAWQIKALLHLPKMVAARAAGDQAQQSR